MTQIAKQIGNNINLTSAGTTLIIAGAIIGLWITESTANRLELITLSGLSGLSVITITIAVTRDMARENESPKKRVLIFKGWAYGLTLLVCAPMVMAIARKFLHITEEVLPFATVLVIALAAAFLFSWCRKNPIVIVGAFITVTPVGTAWANWLLRKPEGIEWVIAFIMLPIAIAVPTLVASGIFVYCTHRKAIKWRYHRIKGPLSEIILMASIFMPSIILGVLLLDDFKLSSKWENTFFLIAGLISSGVISEPLRRLMRELADLGQECKVNGTS